MREKQKQKIKKVMVCAKYENGVLVIWGDFGKVECEGEIVRKDLVVDEVQGEVKSLNVAVYEFCKSFIEKAGEPKRWINYNGERNVELHYDGELTVYLNFEGLVHIEKDVEVKPEGKRVRMRIRFRDEKVWFDIPGVASFRGDSMTYYGEMLRDRIYGDKVSFNASGKFLLAGDALKFYINGREVAKFRVEDYEIADLFYYAYVRKIETQDLLRFVLEMFKAKFGEMELVKLDNSELVLKLGRWEYKFERKVDDINLLEIKCEGALRIGGRYVDVYFSDLVWGYDKHDGAMFKAIGEDSEFKEFARALTF